MGAVMIIDDDEDDQFLLQEAFKNLGYQNELIFFSNGQKAFDFLCQTEMLPFLILSDMNMPQINGFELKEKIRQNSSVKVRCIPLLFFSTAVSGPLLSDAYHDCAQGVFIKGKSLCDMETTISVIMEYWGRCIHAHD
ncbi:Sensor histidine kinase RcsC [Dyadobacter sp. CECT 9623]|uniref:Sensor histidine kinase RcsC n=1 Tax=Dyadobacter linearis TaxID=2823330 RepID=A0ABM8UYZ6_9BACT|nr:response regulator [Dyadobacter sp. CECT 9623]CAG5074580.1 Sensor histidine kinase RcsC [Dyadobacter sp. CECT 9623]